MFIYKLTNRMNGKIYVGKTTHKNLNSYLSNKRCLARQGKHSHPVVAAMSKYGVDNFTVEVLSTTEAAEWCDYLEVLWIMLLDSRNPEVGYNVHAGGGKGALGHAMSEEHKLKIGAANKGRKPKAYVRTEEHKQQLRDRMKGNNVGRKITSEQAAEWRAKEDPMDRAEWSKKGALACNDSRRRKKEGYKNS